MKKEIVNNASLLFLQYGCKNVTMDDIAIQMSISKKTIYTYFKNKTDLVRAGVFKIFKDVNSRVLSVQKKTKNPIISLYEIKKVAFEFLNKDNGSQRYQLQKYYPKIFAEIKKKEFETMLGNFEDNLMEGIRMGFFRKSIDPKFLSRIYINGLQGVRNVELFSPDRYKILDLLESYIDYHLRAIVTKKGLAFLEKNKLRIDNED